MHYAISLLDKDVISQLWVLNLIVVKNADCAKSDTPLIDEILMVKQLGDSKLQSRLCSFISNLVERPVVQENGGHEGLLSAHRGGRGRAL